MKGPPRKKPKNSGDSIEMKVITPPCIPKLERVDFDLMLQVNLEIDVEGIYLTNNLLTHGSIGFESLKSELLSLKPENLSLSTFEAKT